MYLYWLSLIRSKMAGEDSSAEYKEMMGLIERTMVTIDEYCRISRERPELQFGGETKEEKIDKIVSYYQCVISGKQELLAQATELKPYAEKLCRWAEKEDQKTPVSSPLHPEIHNKCFEVKMKFKDLEWLMRLNNEQIGFYEAAIELFEGTRD